MTEDNSGLTASPPGGSPAAASRSTEVLDKETDGKLFAAALYVITDMWGKEMGALQRASLANQIVREIERRGIVQPAAAVEAPGAERVTYIPVDLDPYEPTETHTTDHTPPVSSSYSINPDDPSLQDGLVREDDPPPVSVEEMVGRLLGPRYVNFGLCGAVKPGPDEVDREAASLLAALAQENSRLSRGLADGNDLLAKVSAALAEQEEENGRLAKALEPFAIMADVATDIAERHQEPVSGVARVPIEDCVSAREALRSRTPANREGG